MFTLFGGVIPSAAVFAGRPPASSRGRAQRGGARDLLRGASAVHHWLPHPSRFSKSLPWPQPKGWAFQNRRRALRNPPVYRCGESGPGV